MNADLMSKLITPTKPDGMPKSASEIFRELNQLIDMNGVDPLQKIPEVDIRFAEFAEQFVAVDQRTKDIVYVSTFFTRAYSDLFIKAQLLKEELSGYEAGIVASTFAALSRLGKPELLTEGLNKKLIKKYCTF